MFINNLEVKVVPSYPEYSASACGKIFRTRRKKLMATKVKIQNGYSSEYIRICINNKPLNRKVHRMVCEAWNGTPPTPLHTDVNHIDGNSLNNHYTNLEWATKSQNQRHAVNTGLKGKGSELYNSQLTETEVHEICKGLTEGSRTIDLSKQYGVSKDIIRKLKAGDTYFHIRQLYKIDHSYKFNYSDATIKWVCQRIQEGYSDKGIVEISTNPNLTIIEIKRIRYKIRYKYISDLYF